MPDREQVEVKSGSVTKEPDANNEEKVKKMLGRSPLGSKLTRWVSLGSGRLLAIRLNWVTSLMAVAILWGFTFGVLGDAEETNKQFALGKSWVSTNFTWLYIGTQDVWCLFLIFICFSRFGSIKLGKEDEKPRFDDFSWFCMLFTCGVAVGLYVFGVAEPLYYYRQPTLWHDWNYDYSTTKTGVENDAQRAQHAIFLTVYHWGIHGWVPYILFALLIGVVSFRWGLPLTVRTCFVPMIGDHAFGLVGDFIDALSVATTTFGVCTSLGIGVHQLARGLQFVKNVGCSDRELCEDAGGRWDITRYGTDNCFCKTGEDTYGANFGSSDCLDPAATLDTCKFSFLDGSNKDQMQELRDTICVMIILVTVVATVSVLSGLDNGIKGLSKIAFVLGLIVMLTITLADNTFYILNVMVQTTGYYLQYIIQVGFDCEAFQQLGLEFGYGGYTNYYWGSDGAEMASEKLKAVFPDLELETSDCGEQPNPCTKGVISGTIAMALYQASLSGADYLATTKGDYYSALLKSFHMSPESVSETTSVYTKLVSIYGLSKVQTIEGIPCSWSAWESGGTASISQVFTSPPPVPPAIPTESPSPSPPPQTTPYPPPPPTAPAMVDSYFASIFPFGAEGSSICDTATVAPSECEAFWDAPAWPRCPETTTAETGRWGFCSAHAFNCPITKAYYDDTNAMFMDWWTIFYWAWWITWAPFVGFFVAIISRGRSMREVIVGGFFCPTLFAIIWFSVFGGLAIKMQRMTEVALQVRPEVQYGSATCSEHYTAWPGGGGGEPKSPQAKALAEAGYYMLDCMHQDEQIYYAVMPYKNLSGFLHIVLWLGLVIYFLTSSDSGSMTDDIITASGLNPGYIPVWQKVFWCFTEGLVAVSLVASADEGDGSKELKALRAASIVIGLPYTILLCFMVTSLYRACKYELGDKDILSSFRFNTQLLDIFEAFQPKGGSPCAPATHVKHIVIGLFCPAIGVNKALDKCCPEQKVSNFGFAIFTQAMLIAWFGLMIGNIDKDGACFVGWCCMLAMLFIIAYARGEVRRTYGVWGNFLEDFTATMAVYPLVLAQISMQVDTDGKDMPEYFKCVDEIKADMLMLEAKETKETQSVA